MKHRKTGNEQQEAAAIFFQADDCVYGRRRKCLLKFELNFIMWFHILPSFAVVVGCLAMPQITTYFMNLLFLGNAYNRTQITFDEAHHYLRDMRVSGYDNAFKQKNLDCLEPEPLPTNENAQKSECPP